MENPSLTGRLAALAPPFLAGLGQEELARLLPLLRAREKAYPAQAFLFYAGQAVPGIGLMLEGRVLILQEDYWGRRSLIGQAGPGELFAEAYALAQSPAGVSVQADRACRVLWLDAGALLGAGQQPCLEALRARLLPLLARKNLFLAGKLSCLGRRTIRQRLLSYLSQQARQVGSPVFSIPYDRQQLADYLAVDRSALSAQISGLQREGVLRCRKNRFELLRPQEE